MTSALDAALEAARRGDRAGFAALWEQLQPSLLRYLRVVAPSSAEDLASETWTTALRDLRRFRGDASSFKTWLFTIARNRLVDDSRARARRPVSTLPDCERLPAAAGADAVALEELGLEWALALVRRLPPDQANAVALRVIAGLDVNTVAGLIGTTPGNVRVLCHRGLHNLAGMVTAQELVV